MVSSTCRENKAKAVQHYSDCDQESRPKLTMSQFGKGPRMADQLNSMHVIPAGQCPIVLIVMVPAMQYLKECSEKTIGLLLTTTQ